MLTPRLPDEPCVLISDGSLGSLVLAGLLSESMRMRQGERPPVLYPAFWDAGTGVEDVLPGVDRATQAHASLYGLDLVADRAGYPSSDDADAMASAQGVGMHRTRLLLDACAVALDRGMRTVVWGIQVRDGAGDGDLDRVERIARVLDRSTLAGRLATIDAPSSGAVEVVVETPIVDLSDTQLADLATDLSVRTDTCWWRGTDHPLADEQSRRFGTVLDAANAGA